ncbi:class I SAM-dependent methyltransferase [Billgrantia lactosivorans]|uniref:class I SAM-dependent methyltransferase n=1 Tax=Billgrantia lactosivorans TaxID=2185141 RepID=UPI000DABE856|nr:methyltransferase domain-containing protein [Halomonas lactosivorans]
MQDRNGISAWQLNQNSAAAYEEYLVGRFFRRWAKRLADHAQIAPDERVLDAGCGTGIVARTVAQDRNVTAKVVGLDVNDGMLAEACRRDTDQAVTWQSGALEKLPFDDDEFDVILSQQVLQFVPDREQVLQEFQRVLAPGGRLVLASLRDISFNRSYEALARTLDRHAGKEAGEMMRSPFSGPAPDTLRKELGAAGFRNISIQHDILDVRFPNPAEYLRQEAASSPLAGPLSELDDDRLSALIADLETSLAPFTDDHGVAFPMETYFVKAS